MTNYFKPHFIQKLANSIAAFGALPFAIFSITASFVDLSSRDKLFEYLNFKNNALDNAWKILIPFILIYSLTWHIKDKALAGTSKPLRNDKIWYFGILLSRVLFAIVLCTYGFAKLLGTQFSRPYLMYGTELGDLDGSLVTVAFFSYSSVYGNTIGLLQILCSIAILFRQTARLAFFILLPILGNILFIDFTFDGWEGPRVIISTLMYIALFNLFCDYKEIKTFFIAPQGVLPGTKNVPSLIKGKSRFALKTVAILGVLFFSFYDLYRFKKAVTYAPGYSAVLDGAWYSDKVEQYDDTLYQFQDHKNKIGFFVGDQAAVIKRLGESVWYELNFDDMNSGKFEMKAVDDSLGTKLINAKYTLLDGNKLQIVGIEGKDSIRWLFTKRK